MTQLDFTHFQPVTDWSEDAYRYIENLAPGNRITADHVFLWSGKPPRPNQMGALFRSASRAGLLRAVGLEASIQPSRHGGMGRVWERI